MALPHLVATFSGLSETHAASAVPTISTVILSGGGSTVSEGATATFNVSTLNIPDSTSLTWVVSHGSSEAADFSSTTGSVTINSNSGSFGVPIVADNTTEGNETFTVSVTGNVSGTAVSKVSSTITIIDTSVDPASPGVTSISGPTFTYEDNTAVHNVATENVPNGSTLNWEVIHVDTVNADFSPASGTFTINSNAGSFSTSIVLDSTRDIGDGQFGTADYQIRVYGTADSATDGIDNTSSAGAPFGIRDETPYIHDFVVPTSINEGSSANITVEHWDIPTGTTLNWQLIGSTGGVNSPTDSNDFTISSGTASSGGDGGSLTLDDTTVISVTATEDNITEGTEYAFIRVSGTANGISFTRDSNTFAINDTSTTPPSIDSVTGPSSVNEGSVATFNVSTTNIPNGSTLAWNVTHGTTETGDIEPADMNGTVTINSNAGSFTIETIADNTTEGSETFTVTVSGTVSSVGVSRTSNVITINDTSVDPASPAITGVSVSSTNINEGSVLTVTVDTENYTDGNKVFNYTINPGSGVVAGDFTSNSLSGTVIVNTSSGTGTGSFTLTPTADSTTEGNETFTITVTDPANGAITGNSLTVTINDTSTTPAPTYSVTAPTSINEGATGTMNVTTTNVANGTTLYWSVTPTADFATTTGSFTVNSNSGSFTVGPTADQITEGNETGTIAIRTGSVSGTTVATDTFTINDTSTTPTPTYAVSPPSSIDEGSSGTINVTTTNVTNGTVLYWSVTTGDTPVDFDSPGAGTVAINSNAGSFSVTPIADTTTEGAETASVTIRTGSQGGTIVATDTFIINDTSITPATPIINTVTGPSSVDEGSAATINVGTSNIPNGTVLNWSVTNDGDFGTSSGTVTINSNAGSFTVTPTVDNTTEGAETFTVTVSGTVSSTAVTKTSASITINDTSTGPTYAIAGPASIDEGSSGTFTVTTTNVPNGTVLYWLIGPASDFNVDVGTLTINSNTGTFSVTPTADSTTEGEETATARVYTDSGRTIQVTGMNVVINDTSTTPAPTYSVTAPTSIDEGSPGTMNVGTTNVSSGTTLYWTVTPSGDFGASSGTVTILADGSGSFSVTPTADSTTEGSETATIQLRTGSTSGTIVATDTFTINDTSTDPVVGSVSFASGSFATEGSGTLDFNFTANYDGTYYYDVNRISGSTGGGEVTNPGPTPFTISGGSGSVSISFTNDSTTEIGFQGEEFVMRFGTTSNSEDLDTLNFTLYDDDSGISYSSSSINIASSASSHSISIVRATGDSSSAVTARVVVDGTSTAIGGTFSLSTGTTSRTVSDVPAQGASKTYRVQVYNGNEYIDGPTYTVSRASGYLWAINAPGSIDEGSTGAFNVHVIGLTVSTTAYWTVTPAVDFVQSSGSFAVTYNDNSGEASGFFDVTAVADSTTEGAETATIEVRTGSTSGTIVASEPFTINDTSQNTGGQLQVASTFTVSSTQTNDSVVVTATGLSSGSYNLATPGPTVQSGSLLCEFNSFFHSMTNIGGGTYTVTVRLDRTGATVGTGTSTFQVYNGFTALSPPLTKTAGIVQNS